MERINLWITSCAVLILAAAGGGRAQENVMTNSGAWTTTNNWTLGHAPQGTETAVINTNISVTSGSPSVYGGGNLVLREGAAIDLGSGTSVGNYFPTSATAQAHLYDGSWLEFRDGTISKPIVLYGNATIQKLDQGGSLNINGPISGNYHMTYQNAYWGGRELKINNSSASTYSGGTTLEQHPDRPTFHSRALVYANNAFGTGDVAVVANGLADCILELSGSTTDVIADSQALHLYGDGAKMDLNDDNETINWLFFDGVQQSSGTWGATGSGASNIDDDHFMGTGQLTVNGSGDSSPPWPSPMTFAEVRPLSTTSIVATATTAVDVNTVTYLFTNSATGASSGWQSGTVWTNNVAAGSTNVYMVKAKDSLGNEGLWSDVSTQSPFIYNVMTNNGSWFAGNWSLGHEPMGGETAVINTNIMVTYEDIDPAPYSGDLILREGASLDLGAGNYAQPQKYFPSGPGSEVHCYDGTMMEFRGGTATKPIVLDGNLAIQHTDQASLSINSPIIGSGSLTFQDKYFGGREFKINTGTIPVTSTYSGGTTIEPHPGASSSPARPFVYANNSFGTGDVTINGATASATLDLAGTTTDVIDDTASLYMVGTAQLDLNGNDETIDGLFFDGVRQRAGTWGATGTGATNIDDARFAGTGVLTALGGPSAGAVITIR